MEVFKKFDPARSSRYNNALHASFHTQQLVQLQQTDENDLEAMHVSGEMVENYGKIISDLTDRSLEARASTDTKEATLYDEERGRMLSVLFYLVASGLSSAMEQEQEAARTLDVILRGCKGFQNKAKSVKTQIIRGLLLDLEKTKAAEAVETLHLSETVSRLETANDKFEEVKDLRIKNRHDQSLQAKMPELRRLADLQLEKIQDLIRATGVIAQTRPESAGLLDKVNRLIDNMNAVTRYHKTTYNQSMAHKGSHKNPDGEDGGEDGGESM